MTKAPLLVADIGGTRARFARSPAPGKLAERCLELPVVEHPTFEAALESALAQLGAPPPARLAVAVAGPVAEGRARLTNGVWALDEKELARRFGFSKVRLYNDFEAVALALPLLGKDDLEPLGGGPGVATAPRVVLGPGTGLGVAALVAREGTAFPVAGEGGHVSLPSASAEEDEILCALRARFGHVSAERAVSGQGLENLYTVLGGSACPAAEIAKRAAAGDPAARDALRHFAAFLGTVAADLALSFGARGGVYLAGGVLPKLGEAFDRDVFRQRFEGKGRFSTYLAGIPRYLILNTESGLLGLTAV